VIQSSGGSAGITLHFTGPVTGKHMCAGVLYLTMLVGTGEVTSKCDSATWDDCQNAPVGSTVNATLWFEHDEGTWIGID
jgi:hypothetical protein